MVNEKAQAGVQASLDSVTSNAAETGVPGLVFVAVDRKGETIAACASGNKGLSKGKNDPMTLDTVFYIASCTKIIATIAVMQAVEQGKLHLDDHEEVYRLCPELEAVKVLQDDGTLVEKKKPITLRMLLTHTAGFGYDLINEKLRDYGRPLGYDIFDGTGHILRAPLVNQPGEKWEYSIGIDWAGVLLQRATGVKLNDWIQQHIMQPLQLESINMFPTEEMKKNLAYMHQRWPGSNKSEERDHVMRAPLIAQTDEEKAAIFHSGGAGAFAKPTEYVQVLATLLNNGTSPRTGAKILKPETVHAMFENQIPDMPDFARTGVAAAKPDLVTPGPEFYPQEGNPPQGWGLSFHITQAPGPTGRGKNTAWWSGVANLFWWCDREKGVAGMIASQMFPFGDPHVIGTRLPRWGDVPGVTSGRGHRPGIGGFKAAESWPIHPTGQRQCPLS